MILQQFNATKNHQLCKKFLHITDFFSHFSCGEHFPHNIMSCGEFLHMKICHVKKFLHMTKKFSTGTACGACDKYQVCAWLLEAHHFKTFKDFCPGILTHDWQYEINGFFGF